MSDKQTGRQVKVPCKDASANDRKNETRYPFLVHSQESLSQQSPPYIDNQRLARQKRRRTSPEDHAILEAEYEQNPKPDKAARLEIAKKVALGEKEVQIWFQNRRQVTRRKSRPLLPHEIFANLQASSQDFEHAPSSRNPFDQSNQQTPSSSQGRMTKISSQPSDMDIRLSSNTLLVAGTNEESRSSQASSSTICPTSEPLLMNSTQGVSTESQIFSLPLAKSGSPRAERSGGLSRSLSQTLPIERRPRSFERRRSASFIIHDDRSQASEQSANVPSSEITESGPHSIHVTKPSQSPRRTSSLVRISMSLDGMAQVTTSTGTTPSPPRPRIIPFPDLMRRPNSGLRRSFSAIEPIEKCAAPSSLPTSSFRRLATGRSRDARTWEFYCDKDVRDALTEQAEREESGSATAAIALIKSSSNITKAVTAKSNKRNANTQKLEAAKRFKVNEHTQHKLKLRRSQSCLSKTQTVSRNMHFGEGELVKPHRKSSAQSGVFELYNGDSDKENWVPGSQQRSPPKRKHAGSSQARHILQESLRHSSSLGALMTQESEMLRRSPPLKSASTSPTACEEDENGVPDIDDQIEASMSSATGPREADDLDCVQNLLSLSQAAWR